MEVCIRGGKVEPMEGMRQIVEQGSVGRLAAQGVV